MASTIISISVIKLPNGVWCSRLRLSCGKEYLAGTDNAYGKAAAMQAHNSTYSYDLRPGASLEALPVMRNFNGETVTLWKPA